MTLPTVRFDYLGDVYSPFSGLPAEPDDDPNTDDPTWLFICYGDAGNFAYLSSRLANAAPGGEDGTDLEELIERLQVDGGVVLNVNTDWSGLNFYGFAPADSAVSFAASS